MIRLFLFVFLTIDNIASSITALNVLAKSVVLPFVCEVFVIALDKFKILQTTQL